MANYRVRMPGTLPHLMSRNIVSVVITAFMVIASVNGAEAGRRQMLDTNLVDVSCGGYAPNSVLQSVLDIPAAAQDVVAAAVPLYNGQDHSTAACVYESLLWKLLNTTWLNPNDPVVLLASRTLNVSQSLANGPPFVWPVSPGSDAVGGVAVGGRMTAGIGAQGAPANATGSGVLSNGSTSGTGFSNGSVTGQPPRSADVGTTHPDMSSQSVSHSNVANGLQNQTGSPPLPTRASSPDPAQTEPANQTRSWVIRWAMEALVGWGDPVGACNALVGQAHAQQVLQIAGYLRLKYPEQCGLSLLIGAEQLRVVCAAALTALNKPPSKRPANQNQTGGQLPPLVPRPTNPSLGLSEPLATFYSNIASMIQDLSFAIAQTPMQSPGERLYVLATAISSVPNYTLPDGAGFGEAQGPAQGRTPASFWTPGANTCDDPAGCDRNSVNILEISLFSLGGLLALAILVLCTLIYIRWARRNRSPGEANRAAITPAEIAAPDAPLDDFELKSPLAVVLRAITVWLPNGLAAIAYEEPKAGADIEAGVQDDVPRTPKDP